MRGAQVQAATPPDTTNYETRGTRNRFVTWKLVSAFLGIGCLLVVLYLPTTPSYAIYMLYRAVNAHDGTAAASYFDFDRITARVVDDVTTESLKQHNDEEAFGDVIGLGVLALMAKQLAGTARSSFEQYVDDLKPEDEKGTRELTLQALWHLSRYGRTAHTMVTDVRGRRLDVTLRYGDDGWRITELSGPAARSLVAQIMEKVAPNASDKAKRTKAMADIAGFKTALDRFYMDNGFYPTTEQGLEALISAPTKGPAASNYETGGYITRVPIDPWGNQYFYQSDGNTYALKSLGGGETGEIDASRM